MRANSTRTNNADYQYGGVDPLRQHVPREAFRPGLADRDDDLAVDQARAWQQPRQRLDELGEVRGQRLRAARPELHALAVPRGEHPVR